MAAGDIIFEDGTIITPADLEKLIPLITNALGATAKDPSEYPVLERLDDLTSLPVFDAAYNLGRVSILRLKGVNGKNAILRVQGDMLQWSLEGTDIWNDLYSKSELKGDPGAAANMEIGEVTSGDTPAATITGEAPNYKLNLVLVPGGKGDTGDNGKTPVLASVSAQSGETASGNFTEDGFDESGNPKYILDLTLPKGQDGQPAIFEQGTTTTVDPDASASVDVLPNGETAEGNPKYILNFSIPRGQKGAPGEGAGNLLADVSAVTIGKKYLLSPIADGSSEVNMVEYTPPGNATAESAGLMTSGQFQKLEKLSPSYLSNDVTGKKVEYTDDGKLLFEDKETFAVELTLDGKKMSELGGIGTFEISSTLFDLTDDSTSDEIKIAVGGDAGFDDLYNAYQNKDILYLWLEEVGIIYPRAFYAFTETDGTKVLILQIVNTGNDTLYSFEIFKGTEDGSNFISESSTSVKLTSNSNQLYLKYNQYSDIIGFNYDDNDDIRGFLAYSKGAKIELLRNGDGTKALMNDGTYKEVGGDYQLPSATDSALGGIKIGYVASEKNYPVQLDGSDKAYVNVPWTDTNTTYDLATTSTNGLMSSTDKTKLDKVDSYVTASSISNLDVTKKVIYVALTANGSLSVNAGAAYNGQSFSVKIYCSAARTITIPTSGNYVSMCGSSYTCPAGKRVEFHFEGINGQWWIAKLEQQ